MTDEQQKPGVGDTVQVTDRRSGYFGCVLTYLKTDPFGYAICQNNTCSTGVDTDPRTGLLVPVVCVRTVILLRAAANRKEPCPET